MSKEIPNKEGQALNGTGVSIAALVFLLVGVPVVSVYLIDIAIYFGGEEITYSTGENPNQGQPVWVNTGDNNSMCMGNDLDQLEDCGLIATIPQGPQYYNGDFYHTLHGCENYTQQPKPFGAGGFCGSDGYELFVPFSGLMKQNRTFPEIKVEFVSNDLYICDSLNFGDSKIDYELEIVRYAPTGVIINNQLAYFPNENVTMKGTSTFNNGGEYNYAETDLCNPTITVTHSLSMAELDDLNDVRESFFNSSSSIIYLKISLDNLETYSGTPYEYTQFYSPFQGPSLEYHYFNVEIPTYEVDAVNFILKLGILILGLGFWIIAFASTPLWNPIKARFTS